jgi:hypothetical protein
MPRQTSSVQKWEIDGGKTYWSAGGRAQFQDRVGFAHQVRHGSGNKQRDPTLIADGGGYPEMPFTSWPPQSWQGCRKDRTHTNQLVVLPRKDYRLTAELEGTSDSRKTWVEK